MYFYSFLADYDCDTVLCSKQKWSNDELLDILKEFRNRPEAKKCNNHSEFYSDFLEYITTQYNFEFVKIEDELDVFDRRSIDYSDLPPVNKAFDATPYITHIDNDMFKNCSYIDCSIFFKDNQ